MRIHNDQSPWNLNRTNTNSAKFVKTQEKMAGVIFVFDDCLCLYVSFPFPIKFLCGYSVNDLFTYCVEGDMQIGQFLLQISK